MSDFFDKVKGFFSGDAEEIVEDAEEDVGEVAGNVAESVVGDVIPSPSVSISSASPLSSWGCIGSPGILYL